MKYPLERKQPWSPLPLVALILFALLGTPCIEAQTFTVIHAFSGGPDGSVPKSGVTIDRAGNLYGTASDGPLIHGYGVVYKMTRVNSTWVYTPIYEFRGFPDGAAPQSRVIFGPDGALYGTTFEGGSADMGTVYRLTPQATFCHSAVCPWRETIVHAFEGDPDGANPRTGDLLFDAAGNLYGTTEYGGTNQPGCGHCGIAFQLQHTSNGWQEYPIFQFTEDTGFYPIAGFVQDSAGNLYSTTSLNSAYGGNVYQLTPAGRGYWPQTILFSSPGSLTSAEAGLVFDTGGNLYGSFMAGGSGSGGAVFELTPSGNGWNYMPIYSFTGPEGGPQASLTIDAAGNLYGTTVLDGSGLITCGTVFKLTPSGGSWTYTALHLFTCGNDGGDPSSNVTFDAAGNMYGTTTNDGAYGHGVIWEITP